MFEFLKRLFKNQDRDLTFVLFDDDEPESSTSYHFKPSHLWQLFYGALVGVCIITLLLVMFTPLSTLLYNREDAQLRERVIKVSKKVEALQDSLDARDTQLSEMQQVIAGGVDTSFSVSQDYNAVGGQVKSESWEPESFSDVSIDGMLSQDDIIFSKIFDSMPEFPTGYPIDGTSTRGYNPKSGHYGIDIATKKGTEFKAIADGAIVNQDWTVNYGFVLHLQHSNGIITVYKHAASVSKSIGDIVKKGDILGTAGDVGVLSSGPHLHIEIWKNGVPQNPNAYLIKS
ncbi:M23 family metallopeptidase [Fodinibius halophilus]|uniref:M23 family metallopeptidase n=1 Tax=Fodinibius halophilus TaxID=1736908 RepID=A0A6M1T4G8_9BACT|nr:M23 family metallopeptidase [Fodinibius halophilus]NGP86861.1 M23 family metallopeptidase [Fodinibius halophilus]